MRRVLLPFLLLSFYSSYAQVPAKVAISTTGCTVQVYCFPGRFDAYDLGDGSTVYADDCVKNGVTWGIYCVKLKTLIPDLNAAQDSMISILDFLKLDFGIVKAKGYNKDHKLKKNENTRGIYDTWEDADNNKWKIKAWTNGQFIVVMHVHGAKELPEKKTEIFLEGLRFPGDK
ncbi:MAG TPA: hypothetical protein VMZ03_09295 [Chitinophagaceae bacterium]|nr:hypothetical protein [Chitinophagaceae bacterium]